MLMAYRKYTFQVPCSTCPNLYTCKLIHKYSYTYVHLYKCTPTHMYINICKHVHLYTCKPIHMYTSTHIHMYTCTPIHMHTNTHVHLNTCPPLQVPYCTCPTWRETTSLARQSEEDDILKIEVTNKHLPGADFSYDRSLPGVVRRPCLLVKQRYC